MRPALALNITSATALGRESTRLGLALSKFGFLMSLALVPLTVSLTVSLSMSLMRILSAMLWSRQSFQKQFEREAARVQEEAFWRRNPGAVNTPA